MAIARDGIKASAGGGFENSSPHSPIAVAKRSLRYRWCRRALPAGCCRPLRGGILRRGRESNPRLMDLGEFPKLAGDFEGVDAGLLPPGLLVTSPMNCAMMGAAKRNGEFIAGPAAKRPRLHKSDVMRVRGLAAAQQARLLRHEAEMLLVPVAAGSAQREHALADPSPRVLIGAAGGSEWFSSRIYIGCGSAIGRRTLGARSGPLGPDHPKLPPVAGRQRASGRQWDKPERLSKASR